MAKQADTAKFITIAFDEMISSQYEDAARHFDAAYVNEPQLSICAALRAICSSYSTKRGDCPAVADRVSAAVTNCFEQLTDDPSLSTEGKDVLCGLLVDAYLSLAIMLESNAVGSDANLHVMLTVKAAMAKICQGMLPSIEKYPCFKGILSYYGAFFVNDRMWKIALKELGMTILGITDPDLSTMIREKEKEEEQKKKEEAQKKREEAQKQREIDRRDAIKAIPFIILNFIALVVSIKLGTEGNEGASTFIALLAVASIPVSILHMIHRDEPHIWRIVQVALSALMILLALIF